MEVAEIRERVKVRADFSPGGKVAPLLFKRQDGQTFRIARVHSCWEDTEQEDRILYFSVTTDRSDDIFQLAYHEAERTWWLESVMMDG